MVKGVEISTYNSMDLKPFQKDILEEFKEKHAEKVPPHMRTDFELAKWLVARNFNMQKSEAMLLKSVEWRKEWNVDTVLEWDPPEVLVKYYTQGLSGFDDDGSPVLILPFGNIDIRGLYASSRTDDFIKFTIKTLEEGLKIMREKSVGLEVPIQKANFIFDMENFSLRDFTWRPALDVVLKVIQMYEANYPEILKCAYVINAPYLFQILFSIIKPFLHENTMKRIKIFGRSGWKEAILENIPADQLPVHWGGTLADSDGNPKYLEKITIGGKIPEIYYLKNRDTDEYVRTTPSKMQKIIVEKKEKKSLEYEMETPGTTINWEIKAVGADVQFGIFRVSSSGKDEEIISMQKVDSRTSPEEGSFICTDPGTYKLIFDNESGNQAKEILYNVDITPPENNN